MSFSIKKFTSFGLLIAIFFSFFSLLNPTKKTDLVYIWYKASNFIRYSFKKVALSRPNPIFYIDDDKLSFKIKNPPQWSINQISSDIRAYKKFSADDVNTTFKAFSFGNNVVKIAIENGKVSIVKKEETILNGASAFGLSLYEAIFSYAVKKGYVKNVTFLLRFTDFFSKIPSNKITDFSPILGVAKDISKNIEKNIILIPDWMNLNSWAKLSPRIKIARKTFPWDKKINKILWRGGYADVTGFRKKVVEYTKATNSDFVDAKFTVDEDENFMHPEHHLSYKFQLSIDGHTAPWERPVWQLYSNCVMVKQKSTLIQWYYNAIKPDVHYIEVTDDLDDLTKINKYSDQQLKEISQNAMNFAEDNLSVEDMIAYVILVLQKLEKLQQSA